MAWVWTDAKRIHNPDVEAGKRCNAFARQAFYVGRIGDIAKAETEGRDVSMVLQDGEYLNGATLPVDRDRPTRGKALLICDRRIFAAEGCCEAIAEAGVHGLGGRLVKVYVDATALVDEEGSQVVYAV